MSILSKQNVLRFDITVNHFILMQVGKTKEDFDDIEPWYFLADSFVLFD